MHKESGFTLVELMVVVAIMAVLASVATPAYVNYQNRAKQSEAVEALLRAKMDQEAFWADNNRYANTIGCLYSFGNTPSKATVLTSSSTQKSYILSINGGTITAARKIYSYAGTDILTINVNNDNPIDIPNTSALKFSVFKWIFSNTSD